jgi:hypothetical protein
MSALGTSKHDGPEWKETAEKQSEHILANELSRRGWEQAPSDRRRKADPEKLKMAARLRAETSVT